MPCGVLCLLGQIIAPRAAKGLPTQDPREGEKRGKDGSEERWGQGEEEGEKGGGLGKVPISYP